MMRLHRRWKYVMFNIVIAAVCAVLAWTHRHDSDQHAAFFGLAMWNGGYALALATRWSWTRDET